MQRSFDELGMPLCDVTFVVLDLETTGGSPVDCAITEVGAVKYRGGECLGVFQSLVNPGSPIPPAIVYLTGITEAMVGPAPCIDAVLPALAEFIGDAVVVGHNVRFDLRFLRANLVRLGYPALPNPFVDTCSLARRLIRDEVPNCKLVTVARHFRTVAGPCHRALDDAKATAEVFHCLLERAGSFGVTGLDDLMALGKTAAHPQASKLRWVAALPRRPGVYLFRDGAGRVLYVGRAAELRRRVRSYFSGDERRKIGPLLREAQSLHHVVCPTELEAGVLEVRLIHEHSPRFNREAKAWTSYRYVKLTLDEAFPRLAVVRAVKPSDGCLYLGPVASVKAARLVVEAIETVVPLRRCTARLSARTAATREAACLPAQLGVASCPCAGDISPGAYRQAARRVVDAVDEPRLLLDPLQDRMRALSRSRRFEEAAEVRDRADALARVVAAQRQLARLIGIGAVVVELPDGSGGALDAGRVLRTWGREGDDGVRPLGGPPPPSLPVAAADVDELVWVTAWLDRNATLVRLRATQEWFSWEPAAVPRFRPGKQPVVAA